MNTLIATNVGSNSSTQINQAGGISSTALSIPVDSNFSSQARANFTSPYTCKIGNEKIRINPATSTDVLLSVASATPGLGRGFGSTTPATHADNAEVAFAYAFDRACGSGYSIECEEDQIATDSGIPGFTMSAHRRHYGTFADTMPWNADGALGRLQRDFDVNRFVIQTVKAGSFTWRQAADASPSVNVTLYNQMVAFFDAIAVLQDAQRGVGTWGATSALGFNHEPNGDEANAVISGTSTAATGRQNWREAYENMYAIATARGVEEWQGTWDNGVLTTTTEGIMWAMNLVWGASSFPASMPDDWWPTSWTWANDHMVMPAADGYNRGPNWRRFAYVMGATDITGAIAGGRYKKWTDDRRVVQEANGRSLMQAVFETGCLEAYSGEFTNLATADWIATGLAATKANWYADTRDYAATWPGLFALAFFDSNVNSIAEWPHDTAEDSWAGWNDIATDDAVFSRGG